jgi:uncharacterized protein (DUF488 family)
MVTLGGFPMPLYTIGHSNHNPERLFVLLAPFGITHLIDVRRVPFSGRFPFYNRDNLRELCRQHGIVYEWWGDSLGGNKWADQTAHAVTHSSAFRAAIERLARDYADDAENKAACLICAEWDPRKCHRSMLIGPALRALPDGGLDLQHILPDGTLLAQSELEEGGEVPRSDRAGTLPLFNDP